MNTNKLFSVVILLVFLFSCGNGSKDESAENVIKENDKKIGKDEIIIERLSEVEVQDLPQIERKELTEDDKELINYIQTNYEIEIRISSNYLYVCIENENKVKRTFVSEALNCLLKLSTNILDLKIGENIIIADEDYLRFSKYEDLLTFSDLSGNLNDQNSSFLENMNYLKDVNIISNKIGLKTMTRLSMIKYLDKIQIGTDLKNPNILTGLNDSESIRIIGLTSSKNVEKSVLELILSLNLPNLELVVLPEEDLTKVTRDETIYYNDLYKKRFPKFDYIGHMEDPKYAED